MKKVAIKYQGKIIERAVFDNEREAKVYGWSVKKLVSVYEFMVWYRINDDKDFYMFYSDCEKIEDAIDEAIKSSDNHFAITHNGKIVSRYGLKLQKQE